MTRDLLGSIYECLAFDRDEHFVVFIVCEGIQYINAIEHKSRGEVCNGETRSINNDYGVLILD